MFRPIAVLLLAMPATVAAQRIGLVPIEVRVPKAPSPVAAEGRIWLNYEVELTHVGSRDQRLTGLDILDQSGRLLQSVAPADLPRQMMRLGGARDSANPVVLAAGRSAVVFLWLDVPPGQVPARLRHRILMVPADSAGSARPDTLVTDLTEVLGPAAAVSAPLRGGPWVAGNGPGNTSGHRRTRIPIGGTSRIAQRFATDWLKYGPDGRAWKGDSTVNANWYGYGEPLLAVADGRVVAVKDGIPENVPLSPDRAVPITLETVGGNHVIIDLGLGRYAFYAHMVPGSIAVKIGDQVRRGQVLGKLGNSGNSDAPHLHFHIGDAPSPLGSEGIPFVLEHFEQLGKRANLEEALLKPWVAPGIPATVRHGELPLENAVVAFPQG